jgi:hypothetical protein
MCMLEKGKKKGEGITKKQRWLHLARWARWARWDGEAGRKRSFSISRNFELPITIRVGGERFGLFQWVGLQRVTITLHMHLSWLIGILKCAWGVINIHVCCCFYLKDSGRQNHSKTSCFTIYNCKGKQWAKIRSLTIRHSMNIWELHRYQVTSRTSGYCTNIRALLEHLSTMWTPRHIMWFKVALTSKHYTNIKAFHKYQGTTQTSGHFMNI